MPLPSVTHLTHDWICVPGLPSPRWECPLCLCSRASAPPDDLLCPDRVADALSVASSAGLFTWANEVKAWRQAIPNRSLKNAALALAEESGEVCRAVLKADEGIRRETRGNLGDEVVDVLITAIGVADEAGLDLAACIQSRWTVIRAKTFMPETSR